MQLAAFALFRAFDAAKPGPVAWADQLFKARRGQPIGWRQGFGILFDDLVAACARCRHCPLETLVSELDDRTARPWRRRRRPEDRAAWTMCTAESCTGGLIAAACTSLAGSSDWFERGVVTYSNEAKTELLGCRRH
jgi:hypothetical protein